MLALGKFNGTTAVATTLFANICVIIMENIYVKKVLKVNFNIFSIDKLKYMFISLIFIPFTIIIRQFTGNLFESQELNAIVVSIITITINGLIYLLILFIIKDENIIEVKNKILNKIKK